MRELLRTEQGRPVWKRIPRGGKPHLLQIKEGALPRWQPEAEAQSNVFVKGLVRWTGESWHGWHRHITLAMFAHAVLLGLRIMPS